MGRIKSNNNYFFTPKSCKSPSSLKKKISMTKKLFKQSSLITPFAPFIGSSGLKESSGHINCLLEAEFNVHHPVDLNGRQNFV